MTGAAFGDGALGEGSLSSSTPDWMTLTTLAMEVRQRGHFGAGEATIEARQGAQPHWWPQGTIRWSEGESKQTMHLAVTREEEVVVI